MNRIIKFALGILMARALGRAGGWWRSRSPLSRGADAMADRTAAKSKTAAPFSPAKGAGWL